MNRSDGESPDVRSASPAPVDDARALVGSLPDTAQKVGDRCARPDYRAATELPEGAAVRERAAVWGAAAAVLNFTPCLGSMLITSGGGVMFGFLQFGTVAMTLAVGGAVLALHGGRERRC